MRVRIWLSTICLAVPLVAAGCGGRSALRTAPPLPPECELFESAGETADSITVALMDEVELEIAPWARNFSERLVFHHLYETLTTVDCLGNVRAGLAVSWKRFDSGRHWVFELRGGAEFWDGTPVTARDVVTSWSELAVEPGTIRAVVDSVAADGDHLLHVYFKRPRGDILRVFSALEFAVVKSPDVSPWPVGSGPYRILSAERRSSENPQRAIAVEPANGSDRPLIIFMETKRRDARDLLEGTADVMVTADPTVLSYAARHPQLATAPLPWTRTYLLLSTSRVDAIRSGRSLQPVPFMLVEGLARDAVRGDA
ncbi:MAG: ABC transporter substrate-binding protein, partial [bacterium]